MTLCIAWKNNNNIHFASDSRATISGNSKFDHCVKIVSVPIKIFGPLSEGDKHPNQIYEQTIGLCFSGGFLNAYTIKETITHALSSLQVIPGITEVSMDQISQLIFKFYSVITKKTSEILFEQGQSMLLITGYCHKENKIRSFKLSFDIGSSLELSISEILKNENEIEFIGSGGSEAKRLYKDLESTPPLNILKDIIEDKKIESVGGAVQYGSIEGRDFKVYGIADVIVDEEKKEFHPVFYYNGLNFMDDPFAINWDEFHLKQTYIDPYRDKINRLIEMGYNVK